MTTCLSNISEAMNLCFKNAIRVYPVLVSGSNGVKIQVINHGKKYTYDKVLFKKDEINKSITDKYFYYANNILKSKEKLKKAS